MDIKKGMSEFYAYYLQIFNNTWIWQKDKGSLIPIWMKTAKGYIEND